MADAYVNRDAATQQAFLEQHLLNDLNDPLPNAEPSLAQLVSTLISDAQVLVRKEFSLARHEIQQEIEKTRQAAIILGIGAAIVAIGGVMLLVALVQGLVVWFSLPVWVSYLIIGVVLAIVGGILVTMGGAQLKQVHPVPEQAIDSVRKDISWLKEQNPSDKI
jgi:membrane protein required for beta-lactamase induction